MRIYITIEHHTKVHTYIEAYEEWHYRLLKHFYAIFVSVGTQIVCNQMLNPQNLKAQMNDQILQDL